MSAWGSGIFSASLIFHDNSATLFTCCGSMALAAVSSCRRVCCWASSHWRYCGNISRMVSGSCCIREISSMVNHARRSVAISLRVSTPPGNTPGIPARSALPSGAPADPFPHRAGCLPGQARGLTDFFQFHGAHSLLLALFYTWPQGPCQA